MKTLVALSALTAIAIAAPDLPGHRYVGYNPISYRITPSFPREKKSAIGANHGAAHLSEAQQFPRVETNHMAEVSGRTFGLKKPTKVKHKSGYQLYRDSDEEQAHVDSQEKCTKEVNVKLCDAENPEARSIDLKDNSTCESDLHNSKSDIEQSIKAKQAVEKLQHTKHDWKHSNSGPDAELHKDIEVARQAIEHILQNFGNLETMKMQAANAEASQDANLHIAKGKIIAQWMEAINNIIKNAEIARNLEEGFTASNPQVHMINNKKSNNDLENAHNHEIAIKYTSSDEHSHMDKLEAKTGHVATHEDMKAAASEIKEATFDHKNTLFKRVSMPVPAIEEVSPDTPFAAKSDLLDKNIHSENGEAKSSELDLHLKHPVAIEHKSPSEPKEPRDMKSAEVIKMEMAEIKQSENAKKALELAIDTLRKSSMKSYELRDHFVHRDDIKSQPKGLGIEKNNKSTWKESKDNEMLAKASEHMPTTVDHRQIEMNLDFTHQKADHDNALTAIKSVKHPKTLQKEFMEEDKNHSHMKMKSSDINLTKMLQRHDHHVAMKSADQVQNSEQTSLKEGISTSAPRNNFDTDFVVKMRERLNFKRHHHLHEESEFPAQVKTWQAHQMPSAKNAAGEQNVNDLHNTDTQRVVTFGLPTSHYDMIPMHHHYNLPHYPSAHHRFDYPSHDFHHSFHGDGMHIKAAHAEAQEKSAQMDNTAQGKLQMNIDRLSGKSALEHNTHWKQEQMAAARGAYGPYGLAGSGVGAIGASVASLPGDSSGVSGAIGVFPRAKARGNAIPLFLSCSPSVVSGSVARAQPGYGASAYRTGENINLHSKRDTKKSEKIPATKAKWSRSNGQ